MLVAVGHRRWNYPGRARKLVVVHLFKRLFPFQRVQLFVMGFGPFFGVGVTAGFRGGLWLVREALESGVEREGGKATRVWRCVLVRGCHTRMKASSKAVMSLTSLSL